ncbi:uncharacterized protein LOC124175564 [Neodiprion fabricii]|uniref:uncharacterized protein LOC124175564 n=1 Tax=Neodiprion fabricii TaxID=2872261 RepID=UPI001ED8E2D5|nr:uncharacterized protein LOC124175564 [Neodiprion fabricii]
MKMESSRLFLAVAAMSMTMSLATPIIPVPRKVASEAVDGNPSSEESIARRQKATGPCLRIAPDLPPCNFDVQATWRSTSGEIFRGAPGSGYPSGSATEFLPGGSGDDILKGNPVVLEEGGATLPRRKSIEEFELYANDIAVTIVYYLEGCLPSRLPFDLPTCPVEESRKIQLNKLIPFQLPDIYDAMIFPEIDVEQIEIAHRRNMQNIPARTVSHEASKDEYEREKDGGHRKIETSYTDLDDSAKGSGAGFQDFHSTIAKKSMRPRTGMASTKYSKKLPASGQVPADSGYPWTTVKNEERSVGVVEEEPRTVTKFDPLQEGIGENNRVELPAGIDAGSRETIDGATEVVDTLARYKNRAQ